MSKTQSQHQSQPNLSVELQSQVHNGTTDDQGASSIRQTLYDPSNSRRPQKRVLNDYEKHEGWLQNIRMEKRSMITSLKNSIDRRDTQDKQRAKRLLDLQLQDDFLIAEKDPLYGITHGPRLKKREIKKPQQQHVKIEVPTTDAIANARNQLYMEPFDVFDPHMPRRGKKIFNENFRPLRSKINLEIHLEEARNQKKKEKMNIEQSFLDQFDKKYAETCNQQKMRIKQRNVSYDSPFDPMNKPPAQHLNPERILEKPCKIDLKGVDLKKIPLAGRLGDLGQKILADPLKAKHLTTGPWGENQFGDKEPRFIKGKRTKPITGKLNLVDPAQVSPHSCDNFNLLHRRAEPLTAVASRQQSRMPSLIRDTSSVDYGIIPNLSFVQNVRDGLSRSPKGVRANESRIQYLVKAKMERQMRLTARKQRSTGMFAISPHTQNNWNQEVGVSPSPYAYKGRTQVVDNHLAHKVDNKGTHIFTERNAKSFNARKMTFQSVQ